MAKSVAFARIKLHVLELTLTIPCGRVAAFADIAQPIRVVPRHVAYILATLSPDEESAVPWYRVVSAEGLLLAPRDLERTKRQAALLRAEGVSVTRDFRVRDFDRLRFTGQNFRAC